MTSEQVSVYRVGSWGVGGKTIVNGFSLQRRVWGRGLGMRL